MGAVVSRQKETTGTLALCDWEMLNEKRVREAKEEEEKVKEPSKIGCLIVD
jgi:hypothetical protein